MTDDKQPSCPRCNVEMIDGFMVERGSHGTVSQPRWVSGEFDLTIWGNIKGDGREAFHVRTLRCPKCQLLESYASDRVWL